MKFPLRFIALVFLVLSLSTRSSPQTAPSEGAQQFAELGDFRLEDGSVIRDFRLGYRTLGKLNAEKSNAILWPSWLGGKSQDLLQFVGAGNVADTARYFVILVDAIGDGVSRSPSNRIKHQRVKFAEFCILQIDDAEHRIQYRC